MFFQKGASSSHYRVPAGSQKSEKRIRLFFASRLKYTLKIVKNC